MIRVPNSIGWCRRMVMIMLRCRASSGAILLTSSNISSAAHLSSCPNAKWSILARYYGVDPQLLGAPEDVGDRRSLKLVPKLAVGASAGAGALAEGEVSGGQGRF